MAEDFNSTTLLLMFTVFRFSHEVYLSIYVSWYACYTVGVTIKLFVHLRVEQYKQHDSTH